MLIKRVHLDGIKRGDVTLAFRRWKRPTVRTGGTLNTAIGQLAIESVEKVTDKAVTPAAAHKAGYATPEDLKKDLATGADRSLYRIRLKLAGADPRAALRKASNLTAKDVSELEQRLARFDAASRRGPWTAIALRLIAKRPETLAATLAAAAKMEKAWFKGNVRKLKALGLTESLDVGYRLSPRGKALLKKSKAL